MKMNKKFGHRVFTMTVLNAFYAFATYGKSAKFYFTSN